MDKPASTDPPKPSAGGLKAAVGILAVVAAVFFALFLVYVLKDNGKCTGTDGSSARLKTSAYVAESTVTVFEPIVIDWTNASTAVADYEPTPTTIERLDSGVVRTTFAAHGVPGTAVFTYRDQTQVTVTVATPFTAVITTPTLNVSANTSVGCTVRFSHEVPELSDSAFSPPAQRVQRLSNTEFSVHFAAGTALTVNLPPGPAVRDAAGLPLVACPTCPLVFNVFSGLSASFVNLPAFATTNSSVTLKLQFSEAINSIPTSAMFSPAPTKITAFGDQKTFHVTIATPASPNGAFAITLAAGTAQSLHDSAGNTLQADVTTSLQVVSALTAVFAPVATVVKGAPFQATLAFNNDMATLPIAADLSLSGGGSITGVSRASNSSCTVSAKAPGAAGTFTLLLTAPGLAKDVNGQQLQHNASTSVSVAGSKFDAVWSNPTPTVLVAGSGTLTATLTFPDDAPAAPPVKADFHPPASSVAVVSASVFTVTFVAPSAPTADFVVTLPTTSSVRNGSGIALNADAVLSGQVSVISSALTATLTTKATKGTVGDPISYALTFSNPLTAAPTSASFSTTADLASVQISPATPTDTYTVTAVAKAAAPAFVLHYHDTVSDGVHTGVLLDVQASAVNVTAPSGNPFGHGCLWDQFASQMAVDTGSMPIDFTAYIANTGITTYMYGFLVGGYGPDGSMPGHLQWGGTKADMGDNGAYDASIKALRTAGGDVFICTGGARAGTTPGREGSIPAAFFTDVDVLHDEYLRAILAYNATKLGFDIEGQAQTDSVSLRRREDALVKLQETLGKMKRFVQFCYVLPVLGSGLTQDCISLLQGLHDKGVAIDEVTLMAMDYSQISAPDTQGTTAISAGQNTAAQLVQIFKGTKTLAECTRMITLLPMLGVTDSVIDPPTYPSDMDYIGKHWTGGSGISGWSARRDRPGPGGFNSSGLTSVPQYTFGQTMAPFTLQACARWVPTNGNAPDTPAAPVCTSQSKTGLLIKWDYCGNGVKYGVYRDGALVTSTAKVTFQDSGLTPGTTYHYTITAFNDAGVEGTASSATAATTKPASYVVPAPANLATTLVLDYQVALAWQNGSSSESMSYYTVYRDGKKIKQTTGTSYIDNDIVAATTYAYEVEATQIGQVSAPAKLTVVSSNWPNVPEWSSKNTYNKGVRVKCTSSRNERMDFEAIGNSSNPAWPVASSSWPWKALTKVVPFDWKSGNWPAGRLCMDGGHLYKAKYEASTEPPGGPWEQVS